VIAHVAGARTGEAIGPAAQRGILDRPARTRHDRYADEVARWLHAKKARRKAARKDDWALF
jgi:hypothetical protein